MEDYNPKIEHQFCFPLYVCAKEVVRSYTPLLDKLDLTYTQYITMRVLWERGTVTGKQLGELLYLDSGTLTPLLKKLESKGYVRRERRRDDERMSLVTLTDEGRALRGRADAIPQEMCRCVGLTQEETETLCALLNKIIGRTAGAKS